MSADRRAEPAGPAEPAERAERTERDELYVGYLPKAPPRVARWMRRVVPALVAGAAATVAIVAALQAPFDPGVFEYGRPRAVQGTLLERPYPMLIEGAARSAGSLLVRQGKHGAAEDAAGLDGRRVRLEATRIESPLGSMLEIVSGILEIASAETGAPSGVEALGRVSLAGEIVDSKCYLGVMKPGRGKPHRSCAARCLSGGVPPQLLVEAADGSRRLLLLAAEDGSPLAPAEVVPLVGEPVEAEGSVERQAGILVLRVAAGGLRRAGAAASR